MIRNIEKVTVISPTTKEESFITKVNNANNKVTKAEIITSEIDDEKKNEGFIFTNEIEETEPLNDGDVAQNKPIIPGGVAQNKPIIPGGVAKNKPVIPEPDYDSDLVSFSH